jgi:hypothetical protein
MPTEVCSECHRNPVERGHYVCNDCEAKIVTEGAADSPRKRKRLGAAGPKKVVGKIAAAPGQRWHLSPLFIALVAVVAWSCSMAWQTYHNPVNIHSLGVPAWIDYINHKVSTTAHYLIDTMK